MKSEWEKNKIILTKCYASRDLVNSGLGHTIGKDTWELETNVQLCASEIILE
jgi:hypothetical protein